jgi:hypothetical protein
MGSSSPSGREESRRGTGVAAPDMRPFMASEQGGDMTEKTAAHREVTRHLRAVVLNYDPVHKTGQIRTETQERLFFDASALRNVTSGMAEGEHVVATVDKENRVVELMLSLLS